MKTTRADEADGVESIIEPDISPSLQTPSRGVTMREVAKLAGANKSSVSVVLNGSRSNTGVSPATRERILSSARALGYEANPHAQRLARGRCPRTVALFPALIDVGLHTRQLLLIQDLLHEQGHHVPIHSNYWRAPGQDLTLELLSEVCRQQPRAIVCGSINENLAARLRRYQAEGGFVVVYSEPAANEVVAGFDAVLFDTEGTVYQAARHLLELGHRRVGFFNVGDRKRGGEWMQGFGRALGEFGLEVRDEWRFCGGDTRLGLEEGGASLAEQFLSLPEAERPSGLCVVNDHCAATFIACLERAGLQVPQDVSVVGYDDLPIARWNRPALTTVAKPLLEIARQTVQLLNARLHGLSGEPERRIVHGELQVRESSAPPRC